VEADDRGRPVVVYLRGGVHVSGILDRWRIDDEWWRKEISRMYFHVHLEDGRVLTVFQDLIEGGWFLQTTATPLESAMELPDVLVPHETVGVVASREEASARAGRTG
jgi:hypothetical protein